MPQSYFSSGRIFKDFGRLLGMFALGLVVGVFFHYLLFRLGLPVQPFIYAAF